MKHKTNFFGMGNIYETYQRLFGKNRAAELEKELLKLEASNNYLYTRLNSFQIKGKIIDTNWEAFRNYVLSKITLYNLNKEVGDKIMKITDSLLAVNKLYRRRLVEFNNAQKKRITKGIFNDVIYKFNKTLINEELLQGELLRIPSLGILSVIRMTRNHNRRTINWGASNKYKAQLIAEGKTPREYTRDNKGNILTDNGGEDWLLHFTDDYYYKLHWKRVNMMGIMNSNLYAFTPSKTGFLSQLGRVKKEDNLIHLRFKEHHDI